MSLRLRTRLQVFKVLKHPISEKSPVSKSSSVNTLSLHSPVVYTIGNCNHLRSDYLLRQLIVKALQLLKSLQSRNRTSILDTVTEERRQHLDLLAGEKLWRQFLNYGGQVGDSLPPNQRVPIVDVFAQRLYDFN